MAVSTEKSVVVDRPVEEVFALVGDFENDVRRRKGIHESRQVSGEPMGVGTELLEGASMFGLHVTTRSVVTEYEPGHRRSFRAAPGLAPAWGTDRVDSPTPCTWAFPASLGSPPGRSLLAPVLGRRRVAVDHRRLKGLLESSSRPAGAFRARGGRIAREEETDA